MPIEIHYFQNNDARVTKIMVLISKISVYDNQQPIVVISKVYLLLTL
jgi:hypothetical protein